MDVLELFRLLDPVAAMTSDLAAIRPLLYSLPDCGLDRELAAAEYGLLHKRDWGDRSILTKPIEFWIDVYKTEGLPGGRFVNISAFALMVLSMPFSNASVERVFSTMNIVKSRLRNRMQLKMLDSVLGVRYGLTMREETCKTFTVSADMMKRFNMNSYLSDDSRAAALDDDIDQDSEFVLLLNE